MSALIVTLPDEKTQRLHEIAAAQHVSVDQIIDEIVTSMIRDFDTEQRFLARAARGVGREWRGRELLAKSLGGGAPKTNE